MKREMSMNYQYERARSATTTPKEALTNRFSASLFSGKTDAEWKDASRCFVVGATGLPFFVPICEKIMNERAIAPLINDGAIGDLLFVFADDTVRLFLEDGAHSLSDDMKEALCTLLARIVKSRGVLNEDGEHIIDLKSFPVGSHYAVNLLIGDRTGYAYPLFTTPKSALDAFGTGSFRAGGALQVLATRYTLTPEENGEPVNRQFYLIEKGKKIFYSLDISDNVRSAFCRHSRNYSEITYETECGLKIRRTIFILPQEEGLPEAVELQRIAIENLSGHDRALRIVVTGMFGIAPPETIANDVIFANIVQQSEIVYERERPIAVALHGAPKNEKRIKRFAFLLTQGETMDDFTMSLSSFLGGQTLANPAMLDRLPSRMERKMSPFFAMGKSFMLRAGEARDIDSFAGMSLNLDGEDISERFDVSFHALVEKYTDPNMAKSALGRVIAKQDKLSSYLIPSTDDADFDTYIGRNLPFQVYYQTFVSRSFAWTQKAYRETGFREIQDIFASMYYLVSAGNASVVRELISLWAKNVYKAGYANHDFTWVGIEPGDCSDDQLWLVQAVYRYVTLTDDFDFLQEHIEVADGGSVRSLWDTLMAILCYSGCISVGAHGLPLLDKADWNDTLRLDKHCMKGPQKEALYKEQLKETGEEWGAPLRNTLSESCMNACLLKIAADQVAEMSHKAGKPDDGSKAREIAERIAQTMRKHAWKGDFFARALINDDRQGGYTYLGAAKDGLSADPNIDGSYFINSFSWAILADIADEGQISTMLGSVEKHLKTDAGLRLCTPIAFDRLGANTATSLYFQGDRENGGVFKHASMMAVVASLKAAKTVKDISLAKRLKCLASFMMEKVLPYQTIKTPYETKGNPRFCTQYNNSETGESIGPILSGTASWLTLAVFEMFGFEQQNGMLHFSPVLLLGTGMRYRLNLDCDGSALTVEIESRDGAFRVGGNTKFTLDGKFCSSTIPIPKDKKEHVLRISL